MRETKPLRVAFFASGRGSNYESVLSHILDQSLNATVSFLMTNNSQSYTLELSKKHQIPAYHVSEKTEGSQKGVSDRIQALIMKHPTDLLVLAGYMKSVPSAVIRALPNRIINIHPALLPSFGGQGWYGHHVHEGVINKGCQYSGITIHVVNEKYDDGTIICQRALEVIPDESAERLAARILEIEHTWLWRVVKGFADGVLSGEPDGMKGISNFRRGINE